MQRSLQRIIMFVVLCGGGLANTPVDAASVATNVGQQKSWYQRNKTYVWSTAALLAGFLGGHLLNASRIAAAESKVNTYRKLLSTTTPAPSGGAASGQSGSGSGGAAVGVAGSVAAGAAAKAGASSIDPASVIWVTGDVTMQPGTALTHDGSWRDFSSLATFVDHSTAGGRSSLARNYRELTLQISAGVRGLAAVSRDEAPKIFRLGLFAIRPGAQSTGSASSATSNR